MEAVGQSRVVGVIGTWRVLRFTITRAAPQVTPANLQWFLNSSPLENPQAVFSHDLLSVNLTNLVLTDEGLYTLVASTAAGEGHDSISLDVQGKHAVFIKLLCVNDGRKLTFAIYIFSNTTAPPNITEYPSDLIVVAGTTVTFLCSSWADPEPVVEWRFGEEVITGTRYVVSPSGALTVATVTFDDAGVYTCNVSNTYGWEAAYAELTVQGRLRFYKLAVYILS